MSRAPLFDGLASGYDLGMSPLECVLLRRVRRRAFSGISGRVLELAVGTGSNLPFYPRTATVVAVDVSRPMLQRAARRRAEASVHLVEADVHNLPFREEAFSAVTGSLFLCSVADPARVLSEVRRVLRAGGRLVLVEHTRGDGLGALLTDKLEPCWYGWNGVCHLNRETTGAVAKAGFQIIREQRRVMGILRRIEAVKPGDRVD